MMRILTVLAVGALVLTACGDDDADTSDSLATTETEPTADTDDTTGTEDDGDFTTSLPGATTVPDGEDDTADAGAPSLEGTQWHVDATLLNDETVPVPEEVDAWLLFEGDTIAVNTGCNTGSGSVEIDGETITVGPVALTLKACMPPHADVESRILEVLGEPLTYALDGDSMALVSEDGRVGLDLTAS